MTSACSDDRRRVGVLGSGRPTTHHLQIKHYSKRYQTIERKAKSTRRHSGCLCKRRFDLSSTANIYLPFRSMLKKQSRPYILHNKKTSFAPIDKRGFFHGTPEGTRTPNPQNRNLMLYPLSHRRLFLNIISDRNSKVKSFFANLRNLFRLDRNRPMRRLSHRPVLN